MKRCPYSLSVQKMNSILQIMSEKLGNLPIWCRFRIGMQLAQYL